MPVESLKLRARNPRRADVAAIKHSLEQNGQYRPLVVNRPTMEVLAGNHTLIAARERGFSEIAVTFVEGRRARPPTQTPRAARGAAR